MERPNSFLNDIIVDGRHKKILGILQLKNLTLGEYNCLLENICQVNSHILKYDSEGLLLSCKNLAELKKYPDFHDFTVKNPSSHVRKKIFSIANDKLQDLLNKFSRIESKERSDETMIELELWGDDRQPDYLDGNYLGTQEDIYMKKVKEFIKSLPPSTHLQIPKNSCGKCQLSSLRLVISGIHSLQLEAGIYDCQLTSGTTSLTKELRSIGDKRAFLIKENEKLSKTTEDYEGLEKEISETILSESKIFGEYQVAASRQFKILESLKLDERCLQKKQLTLQMNGSIISKMTRQYCVEKFRIIEEAESCLGIKNINCMSIEEVSKLVEQMVFELENNIELETEKE